MLGLDSPRQEHEQGLAAPLSGGAPGLVGWTIELLFSEVG